jgi:hypothetical protein
MHAAGYREAVTRHWRHAMDTTILAVDLGKFNFVLCWYETATRGTRFRTIRTDACSSRRGSTATAQDQRKNHHGADDGWMRR